MERGSRRPEVIAAHPRQLRGYSGGLANPLGVGGPIGEAAALLAGLYFPALAVLGLLSLASLVVRFRRSRGVERQQLKWFLFAVGFFLLAVVTAIVTTLEGAWYALMFGLAALPVATGIAVLRYRLYDIDRIISRTVSYATVTGVLVVTFAGAILLFQALLAPLTSGNTVAVRGVDTHRGGALSTTPAHGPTHRRSALQPRPLQCPADLG